MSHRPEALGQFITITIRNNRAAPEKEIMVSVGGAMPGNITKDSRRECAAMNKVRKNVILPLAAIIAILAVGTTAYGQTGEAGITDATNQVKGYFDVGVDLIYAIGAIVGLVGAVKVYNKWSNGEQDTAKVASSWFGACIFLVVVATVLRGFFGV